jgi:hypothetical protein
MNIQKTAKKKSYTASDKKTLTAAERRYRSAISKLRSVNRNSIPKELQIESAYTLNEVDRYGFSFFPNHYIFDKIIELEVLAQKATTR